MGPYRYTLEEDSESTATTLPSCTRLCEAIASSSPREPPPNRSCPSESEELATNVDLEAPARRDTERDLSADFGTATGYWHELHLAFLMRSVRFEEASSGAASAVVAEHVRHLLDDARSIADVLHALHANSDAESFVPTATWFACVRHVYAWLGNILEFVTEAIEQDGHDVARLGGTVKALVAYSSLHARGVLAPLIVDALAAHERARDAAQVELLGALLRRIFWLGALLAELSAHGTCPEEDPRG